MFTELFHENFMKINDIINMIIKLQKTKKYCFWYLEKLKMQIFYDLKLSEGWMSQNILWQIAVSIKCIHCFKKLLLKINLLLKALTYLALILKWVIAL